jgi:hypothetical protein
VFTAVEVAFAKIEQDGKALEHDIEQKIDALWAPGSPVKLVEFHFGIAIEARAIIRAGLAAGWKLKPKDAIHLATARMSSCKEFHTYDAGLGKYSDIVGLKIGPPLASQLALPAVHPTALPASPAPREGVAPPVQPPAPQASPK